MSHHCYILANNENNRTYNGYTNNIKRRLRQHNQEIVGGARYTKRFANKSWFVIAYVTGFPDRINALQCEWRIKHPDNKKRGSKYIGADGRIKGLNNVLKLERWTNNSTIDNSSFDMTVHILEEYFHLLTDLPDNITIVTLESQL